MGAPTPTRRHLILDTASDLAGQLFDRKDDEELPDGEVEAAVAAGEVTVDEIIETFAAGVRGQCPEPSPEVRGTPVTRVRIDRCDWPAEAEGTPTKQLP